MPRNGQTPTSPPSSVPTSSLLGIETSCDETAAAVFSLQGHLLSNLVASQHEVHGRFGGVVPELASRKHVERIEEVTQAALEQAGVRWSDLRAIAVTQGPGLAGALVVGVSFGKALAYALGVPCIGVHHLEGHIASAWLEYPDFKTPCIVLVVSGGHTHLYLVPNAVNTGSSAKRWMTPRARRLIRAPRCWASRTRAVPRSIVWRNQGIRLSSGSLVRI